MTKTVTQPSAPAQLSDNPTVLIRYEPENAPIVLAQNASKALARVQTVKKIENTKQMEQVSTIISDADVTAEEVETFVQSLRAGVDRACERVRQLDGFEDFEATLTIRRWSLRSLLTNGISNLKKMRANFLAAEQERQRQEQAEAEARQRKINEEAAQKAAKIAVRQGASREEVADIKREVLTTPAPTVASRSLDAAKAAGVSLTFRYYADCTDLRKFLGYALKNEAVWLTFEQSKEAIEKVFAPIAQAQKEKFQYPGMTFRKVAGDRQR